ncbi:MAG TPA: PhoH family protein [Longimicrobiales bacterium]|nr:PhoH family protein [Longimicrobiales bacterium]
MPDSTTVEHRIPAEGADYLSLAGVNDANLLELARLSSCRVILRGDDLILSGDGADVERAVPVAEHMVQQSRIGQGLDVDEIRRSFSAESQRPRGQRPPRKNGGAAPDEAQVLFAGLKKLIGSKSEGQRQYLDSIVSNDIVIAIGPAGTGKTYLAVAAAVDALRKNRVKRIILARPAVEAGENLGFLPGDLQEKVDPYLRPLYDALEDIMPADWVRRALEARTIEIAPLAYMRGRTLADAFVILDEAQNATGAQMKMFLTRLGLNSRVVITGDKTQIDLPRREDSGLLQVEKILRGIDGIDFIYLSEVDVVRHRLVKDIIRAYASNDDRPEV